jgi:hypothetical protein
VIFVSFAKQQRGDQKAANCEENLDSEIAIVEDWNFEQPIELGRSKPGVNPDHSKNTEGSQSIERAEKPCAAELLIGCLRVSGSHASVVSYFQT